LSPCFSDTKRGERYRKTDEPFTLSFSSTSAEVVCAQRQSYDIDCEISWKDSYAASSSLWNAPITEASSLSMKASKSATVLSSSDGGGGGGGEPPSP